MNKDEHQSKILNRIITIYHRQTYEQDVTQGRFLSGL